MNQRQQKKTFPAAHKTSNVQQTAQKSEIIYPGGVKFSDFAGLIEIPVSRGKHKTYILFNENVIKDYDQCDVVEKKQFETTVLRGKFCFKQGSGLKYLPKSTIDCLVRINNKDYKFKITCELKILSENRIGFYTLKPITDGPEILVACSYIKKGFHSVASVKKTYSSNDLLHACRPTVPPKHSVAFFKPVNKKLELTRQFPSLKEEPSNFTRKIR